LFKGVLYCSSSKVRGPSIAVPAAAIPMIFAYFYDSPVGGYSGVFKTISKIRFQFIWKGMDKDIRLRVRAYQTHALSKQAQHSIFRLLASEVEQRPMQKLLIDFVGKLPRNKAGNTPVLVCVDDSC